MVYILIGVSGCGKTTVGKILSRELRLPFYDGDTFHPENNIKKMKQGIPLNDNNRAPWLTLLAGKIKEWNSAGGGVLACSALKKRYRDVLSGTTPEDVLFIHLDGDEKIITERIQKRGNHFMPPGMLQSQFNDLENLTQGITVKIDRAADAIVSEIIQKIKVSIHTAL